MDYFAKAGVVVVSVVSLIMMFVVMSVVCDAECVNEEVVTPTRGSAATKDILY